jgi:hypothetical protein
MESWVWDIVLFAWGFFTGIGTTLVAVAVARTHGEALREGERLVARLGTVDARRFIQAVTE